MVLGDLREIGVRREKLEVMGDAERREQRVDRSDLDAPATAGVADLGGGDMVVATGNEQRQHREPLDDPRARLLAIESLQELLQHDPRRHHLLPVTQSSAKDLDLRQIRRGVSPQRK